MVEVDPVVRIAVLVGALGIVPVALTVETLVHGLMRWWTRSITVTVARARISSWCACLARRLRSARPPVDPSRPRGGRPSAGTDSPFLAPVPADQQKGQSR
ncbi:hypothetical protein [Gandjariella thermophila]|uniref:Uncharacterized protein n=1 Tax=Gandjariella thermophila TaxID=1931992 RepID=A0A4D4J4Q9_9PSEU|nr:hypothetical protein [Gandjariella thermophila]GDY30090.1 hypothetical protein GTS_17230 [Gandjariella thermophila]